MAYGKTEHTIERAHNNRKTEHAGARRVQQHRDSHAAYIKTEDAIESLNTQDNDEFNSKEAVTWRIERLNTQ